MQEACIAVSASDEPRGPISKHQAHLQTEIDAGRALHRAFSVFLFDTEGRLLLQQRSLDKITFPGQVAGYVFQ